MRKLVLLAFLACSSGVAAQYDAGGQNTQGANVDAEKLDPATKARIRTEGSVGGIQGGLKTESQKDESSSAGASSDAARARAGANASVEGGAALGATGVNTRPAAKTEEAEKEKRRRDRAKRNEKKK